MLSLPGVDAVSNDSLTTVAEIGLSVPLLTSSESPNIKP